MDRRQEMSYHCPINISPITRSPPADVRSSAAEHWALTMLPGRAAVGPTTVFQIPLQLKIFPPLATEFAAYTLTSTLSSTLQHGFLHTNYTVYDNCSGIGDSSEDSNHVLHAVSVDAEGCLCKFLWRRFHVCYLCHSMEILHTSWKERERIRNILSAIPGENCPYSTCI